MPRVILWGVVGMDVPLSQSRSWRMLVRVVAMTMVVMLSFRVRWTGKGVPLYGRESKIVLGTK